MDREGGRREWLLTVALFSEGGSKFAIVSKCREFFLYRAHCGRGW